MQGHVPQESAAEIFVAGAGDNLMHFFAPLHRSLQFVRDPASMCTFAPASILADSGVFVCLCVVVCVCMRVCMRVCLCACECA